MIEIKSRWNDKVLYTAEDARDVKQALEEVVSRDANLRDANLRGADLGGADLRGADLRGADLGDANLRGADLGDANLRGADLGDANLRDANLGDANLRGADLGGADLRDAYLGDADLRDANLRDANLRDADLRDADLRDAYLGDAKGIHPSRVTPLHILLDQPGKVRAYKLVNERNQGPFNGGLTYSVGETVEVDACNTDPNDHCGAGINVATLPWCLDSWRPGFKVLLVEFRTKDIAVVPTATDGKFRCHRVKVIREIDVSEIVNPTEETSNAA